MSSKIHAQIDNLRAIFVEMKSGLINERQRSKALSEDLNKANEAAEQLKLRNAELTSQLEELQNASNTNRQDVKDSASQHLERREDEIDALVKEIEFCIQQLKDKHA